MKTDWTQFKNICDTRNIDILMLEDDNFYYLKASEGSFQMRCTLDKDASDTTDLDEFEDDYKDNCNPVRTDVDAFGKPFARIAVSDTGHSLQWLSFHFTIGKYDTLNCKHCDGATDVEGFTYKIYDSNDDEITSSANEANSVKTVVTFHPQFDLEMMAASLRQIEIPTTKIDMYMVINPDENIGEKYAMVTGGHDLRFFPAAIDAFVDGKAPKKMTYDPVYYTNKMAFVCYHSASTAHECMLQLEYFR